MGALLQDIRYGIRMLLKNPGFAAVAVLTLALGIGANTAIFSVIDAVLLRPLPFRNSSRLVWAWGKFSLGSQAAVSPADFLDYRVQNHVFERWGAIGLENMLFNLAGNDRPQQVKASLVTEGFLEALGLRLELGRSFLASDEQSKDPQVVILSQHLWKERFGGDSSVIGKRLRLDAGYMTVVGVLRNDVPLFSSADVWVPAPFLNEEMSSRRAHFLRPIGLLKPGVSLAQAQAELNTIADRIAKEHADTNTGWGLLLVPLQTALVGGVRQALLVIFGAVGLVLLIACVNVASLLMARNSARKKEIGIRKALGASPFRLVRQLVTESMLLALAGAAAGLLLANVIVDLLKKLGPGSLPRLSEVALNGSVLLFTGGLAILTGVLFGIWPALRSNRSDLTQTFKEGGASGHPKSKHRVFNVLVVAEVALSFVVLMASGLLLNSFWRLTHVNPGFNPANTITCQVSLVSGKYDEPASRQQFQEELLSQVQALPGVVSAGTISELPFSGQANDTFFKIQEHPPADPKEMNDADYRIVGGDYFGTMRIPLLAGRGFSTQDTANSSPVILISEPLAKQYFPAENPIGRHLEIFEGGSDFVKREIVGIVGGIKHFSLQENPRAEMFIPYSQNTMMRMNLVVRALGDSVSLAPMVRETVRKVDSDEATSSFLTMEDAVSSAAAGDRFNALLLGGFGGIALLLTAAGIFGVLSYLVIQRTREIGLRMALGAQPGDVLRVIVGQGMRLAAIGVSIGLIGAYATTRWMASFLFDVKPTDPLTFAAVSVALVATAFMACYFPARRAMRVDPIIALRYE